MVHSSFSIWSLRVSIASRVMSWLSASALEFVEPDGLVGAWGIDRVVADRKIPQPHPLALDGANG